MRRLGLGLAMTGVLAGLGFGAYAVFAASGPPDFSITRTPARQTVNRGPDGDLHGDGEEAEWIQRIREPEGKPAAQRGVRHLAAERRDEVERPPPGSTGPRLAIKTGSNTPTATSHPLITATEREPLAHRNRHPGGPGGVATELQPHGLTLEPISAAGGSDHLQRQGEPVRRLQRAGQAVGDWSPGRRHRLVEPERNRPSLQFGDLRFRSGLCGASRSGATTSRSPAAAPSRASRRLDPRPRRWSSSRRATSGSPGTSTTPLGARGARRRSTWR